MLNNPLLQKQMLAYAALVSLVICSLAGATVTAFKLVHIGLNFPFSNIIFSLFTYPIIDCICELWGKQAARQAIWLGLIGQVIITVFIQLSIIAPHPAFWPWQSDYQLILAASKNVLLASLAAFSVSQLLDVMIYQRLKQMTHGKWLWLRSNVSIYLGQIVDSAIFILIVFHASSHKFDILWGSIVIKIILALLMTPIVYLIVVTVNRYLAGNTLAFKG
jgi:uncharacterized integral membrane protein (TIGR00697 family)